MKTETILSKDVVIPMGNFVLPGKLTMPEDPKGLVIFVHGTGTNIKSTRNNMISGILNDNGFGTFMFNLLTKEEDLIYANRFDIRLLTERLIVVTGWLMGQDDARGLAVGYMSANTGAAAALNAAAKLGYTIKAVVSRSGRPDLSLSSLDQVTAHVLLIVGGLDKDIIELNKKAFIKIVTDKELRIVPGASHLFEEPGKLEEVAVIASAWFEEYMTDKTQK